MAAQTLLLNQDRCTKNFYIYMNPGTKQWSMFPWVRPPPPPPS